MDVNPIELQKYLKGVDYPASKDDLTSTAESEVAIRNRSLSNSSL